MAQGKLVETFVVYFSSEDQCWIAHGLRTDEVGTGDCVVDAVADFLKALDQVVRLARREGDIEILREAPAEIQQKAQSATRLPQELFEIAHRRVHGDWPKEMTVHVDAPKNQRYTADAEASVEGDVLAK